MLDIFNLKYEELPDGYVYEFLYPETWWEIHVMVWNCEPTGSQIQRKRLQTTSGNFSFFETFEYRIKPVIAPEKFQFLIFAKGKYVVTSKKYEDEASVKLGYSYPIEVIQKLENRKTEKSS